MNSGNENINRFINCLQVKREAKMGNERYKKLLTNKAKFMIEIGLNIILLKHLIISYGSFLKEKAFLMQDAVQAFTQLNS